MKTLARWISIVGHPFAIVLVVVLDAALRFGGRGSAGTSILLVALLTILPLALFIAFQVARGRWGDVDASRREERPLLYLVGGAGALALCGWLLLRDPHSFLLRGTFAALGLMAVAALANRWVKVSLHTAFAAYGATVLMIAGSATGWVLAAFIPPLIWSRLAMRRHTPIEILGGLVIGIAAGAAVHWIPGS